jgi:predicted nucleic acid-binding Zn ribbon protein
MLRRAESIGKVLKRTFTNLGLDRKIREFEAVQVFAEVVGEKIAAKAQAVQIDRGVLTVRVASSAWRQELNYTKAEMIDKLNARLGDTVVTDIYFT